MARLIASVIGTAKLYDQEVNSSWFDQLDEELDIISIKIKGLEFISALDCSSSIKEWIFALEEDEREFDEIPLAAYLAYCEIWGKNPSVSTIISKVEEKFITAYEVQNNQIFDSYITDTIEDAKAKFAEQELETYFENLKATFPSIDVDFIENYFDKSSYINDIFINNYKALAIPNNYGCHDVYIFHQK